MKNVSRDWAGLGLGIVDGWLLLFIYWLFLHRVGRLVASFSFTTFQPNWYLPYFLFE